MLKDLQFASGAHSDLTELVDRAVSTRRFASAYFCNVHMAVEAYESASFSEILRRSSYLAVDGAPIGIALKILGRAGRKRLRGPDAFRVVLGHCENRCYRVGFIGGSDRALAALLDAVGTTYPRLTIGAALAPPFAAPQALRMQAGVQEFLGCSDVDVVFVGLGCPKQEIFVDLCSADVAKPMLAVGAAFDFLAGVKPEAPNWMRANGLEWLHRLMSEPARLSSRYFIGGFKFVLNFFREFARR